MLLYSILTHLFHLTQISRALDPTAVVIMSEPTALRRTLTLKHGATHAFDPLQSDIVTSTLKATNGRGVDIAFDAAGVQTTMDAAVLSVRARGTIVNVASWEKPPTIDMNIILIREVIIMGKLFR